MKLQYLLIVLFFWSCSSNNDSNSKRDAVRNSSLSYKIVKIEGTTDHNNLSSNFNINDILTFYKKSKKYTHLAVSGAYQKGEARLSGDDLVLKIDSLEIQFQKRPTSQNWVKYASTDPRVPIELLLSVNDSYQSGAVDLLSEKSNWWRVKPGAAETNEQLEKRLLAQLNYWIDYFKMNNELNNKSFSTMYLGMPFRVYSNGLGLPSLQQQNAEWINYFYSAQDAQKALDMLSDALNSISKYPDNDENYTLGYIKVMEIMVDYIKS